MIESLKSTLTFGKRLFVQERVLFGISAVGFILAAVCAVYVIWKGAIILPEGNVESAFSFNAALAVFILSIAILIPVSGLSAKHRSSVRWIFIISALYSYAVETIQHFRGINPRFSRVGSIADAIAGGLFGCFSMLIIIVTCMLAASFFRKKVGVKRPLLTIAVRYAFFSTVVAFAAGIAMIVLQSRYLGRGGNFMVLHGLGFHALQALPLLGWLSERVDMGINRTRVWIHWGGVSWSVSILFIAIQTILGRNVFELAWIPLLAACGLVIWLACLIKLWCIKKKATRLSKTAQVAFPLVKANDHH